MSEFSSPVFIFRHRALGIKPDDPVTIRIDEGVSEKFAVQTCTQTGCFVGAPVSDALLGAMRGGKMVRVTYLSINKQPVRIALSLGGFPLA
jgi:invasion protein IalB